MRHLKIIGETRAPDGTVLKLAHRDDEYVILANGKSLMSSGMYGSEEALATFACSRAQALERPCVLIGGLGMGFTLRATLDSLPPDATVVVAELLPEVVEWNHGPLGPLAGSPLKDKRVRIETRDVAITLRSSPGKFDAVLLDVDNGPAALTSSDNAWLYDDQGIVGSSRRAQEERGAGRLVRARGPQIREAAAPGRVRCGRRARARPVEKRRPSPHDLCGAQSLVEPGGGVEPNGRGRHGRRDLHDRDPAASARYEPG